MLGHKLRSWLSWHVVSLEEPRHLLTHYNHSNIILKKWLISVFNWQLLIYLASKHILSAYCEPGYVLGIWDWIVAQMRFILCCCWLRELDLTQSCLWFMYKNIGDSVEFSCPEFLIHEIQYKDFIVTFRELADNMCEGLECAIKF